MRFSRRTRQPHDVLVARWSAPSLVKSTQRGAITIASAASATATIAAVDLANSTLFFGGFANSGADENAYLPRMVLTNATTITAFRYTTSANPTTAAWALTEYWPGVVRSVQHGTGTVISGTTNVTINAVDPDRSVVHFLGWRWNDANGTVSFTNPYVFLVNATTVGIYSNYASGGDAGFQVVEFL